MLTKPSAERNGKPPPSAIRGGEVQANAPPPRVPAPPPVEAGLPDLPDCQSGSRDSRAAGGVRGGELLDEVVAHLSDYVVFQPRAAMVVALL